MKNVLSLFDGMSCLQIALNKLGIKYDKYYAAEVDKFSISVTQQNYPKTIQLGDVTKITTKMLNHIGKVDFLGGGSPCQGFSFAGKQINFDDPRSKLFFEYVRILKVLRKNNPNMLFLLENVKMKKEYQEVISKQLGVQPIEINSALVSAQNRRRLYCTNIPNIPQPQDKGIFLKDVFEDVVDEKYYINSDKMYNYVMNETRLKKKYTQIEGDKAITMTERQFHNWTGNFVKPCNPKFGRTEKGKKIRQQNLSNGVDYTPFGEKQMTACDAEKMATLTASPTKDNRVLIGNIYPSEHNPQSGRFYSVNDKSVTISSVGGGGGTGLYAIENNAPIQLNKAKQSNNNTQPFQHNRVYDPKGKMIALDTDQRKNVLENARIRRLTPLECERLQTVPEGYTGAVSDSQRYKMLGNGWTIDVITHILKQIK